MTARRRPWLGVLWFAAFACILAALLFPLTRKAKSGRNRLHVCPQNLKDLGTAMQIYLFESKGVFPPADRWSVAVAKHFPNLPRCPSSKAKYTYAFNEKLGGLRVDQVSDPRTTVLFFEMDSNDPNAHGSAADVTIRHRRGLFVTVDNKYRFSDPSKMKWRP